ncbi:MAG: phosphatase [Ahrensia sp.]|nr:phosphatase [Ahrensia sp.]
MATEGSFTRPGVSGNSAFGVWASPSAILALSVLWVVLLVLFRLLDQWDFGFSGLFFDPGRCAATARADGHGCSGFTLASWPVLSGIREFLHPFPVQLGIVLLVMLVFELALGKRWEDAGVRVKTVLIGVLILGPGLIVNGILKAFWGRPRPWMTEDYGGWLPFVEAGTISGYCDTGNCSFVSGEAASAGWLMCIALILAVYGYRGLAGLFGVVAVAMAGLRVVFGAHYLSDAVLGFLLTIIVFAVLAAGAEGRLAPLFGRIVPAIDALRRRG